MATANKIELARVDELKPYENNARQHSEKQIEQPWDRARRLAEEAAGRR